MLTALAEEVTAQRAEERVGETVRVLVESVDAGSGLVEGRAACQGPEVDGTTSVRWPESVPLDVVLGDMIEAQVTATTGVDLVAVPVGMSVGRPAGRPVEGSR